MSILCKKNIATLKDGVNEKSSDVLDYVYACINNAMFLNVPSTKVSIPQHQNEYQKDWVENTLAVRQKCAECGIKGMFPEVFYFHHGLRFSNEKILAYIKDKDILDCGAYVGDSVLALRPYTSGTIYSFEFSQKTIAKFRNVMEKNGIRSGSVLIEAALGDRSAVLSVADTGKHNNSLSVCPNGNIVHMTTVDEEVKNRRIKVGFI
jgi:FkbM family methyltransferase